MWYCLLRAVVIWSFIVLPYWNAMAEDMKPKPCHSIQTQDPNCQCNINRKHIKGPLFHQTTIFSHTQWVSLTLAITLCPSLLGTFLTSHKLLHIFASNFVWMFRGGGGTPTKFVKIWVLPLFFMESLVILCNFLTILKMSSSIKLLTRYHSYLVWRVFKELFCSY